MSAIWDIFEWINRGADETRGVEKIAGLIMVVDVKTTGQFSKMKFRDKNIKKSERDQLH